MLIAFPRAVALESVGAELPGSLILAGRCRIDLEAAPTLERRVARPDEFHQLARTRRIVFVIGAVEDEVRRIALCAVVLSGGVAIAQEADDALPEGVIRVPPGGTYLAPNVEDRDGTAAYVHVTKRDMPLIVEVPPPKTPPRDGTRREGREAAIEAIRMWEQPVRERVPWFQLEFAEEDPDAAVRVKWKRRIAGPWGGFGRMSYRVQDGELLVG